RSDKKPDKEAVSVKKGIRKNISKDYELKTPDPPEPDVKTSLKKKTFDSEKVIEDAVNRIAEKTDKARPRSIEERIARMESEVGDKTYKGRLGSSAEEKNASGADPEDFAPIEIYQAEVAVAMKRNWAFSREVAGQTEGLETRLVIKILPDGKIADVWFEKRSGNSYLDESAYKTVMKADPLPPLPEGYPHYHLVLGFTPGGLKR
ncbi:MAG: TonB family protein, partial [Desulfobacterales bacterium]|nr:TonB family protein [Desulfobacterales bacterium]